MVALGNAVTYRLCSLFWADSFIDLGFTRWLLAVIYRIQIILAAFHHWKKTCEHLRYGVTLVPVLSENAIECFPSALWIAGYHAKPNIELCLGDSVYSRQQFPIRLMSLWIERKCLYLCTCWHFGCNPVNPLSRSLDGDVQYFIWQEHVHPQIHVVWDII